MTLVIAELERTETRVLGALRCVDATTGTPVESLLQVTMPGAWLRRNRSGLVVIAGADALAAHEAAFLAPPAAPPLGSVALEATIVDQLGRYLPRRAAVALPRDPDPANAGTPGSLFRPIEVPLYPATAAPTGANWALLRVSVTHAGSGDALGGVLLRVLQGATVLARGLSDWRGEALVAVPGVPVTTWSEDPGDVVVNEIAVELEATIERAAPHRTTMADVLAGRAPAEPLIVDPDRLEAGGGGAFVRRRTALAIAAGRSQSVSFALAIPPGPP
jgi:hypothetical protein